MSRTTTQTMPAAAAEPLHQGFFAHAHGAPDDVAVFGPTTRWTYGQLREQALAVSGALAVAGVRIGDRVAVVGPTGLDTVIATLGILAAGGVCVPIDTADPAEPILDHTGVRMALFTGDGPPNWLPALTVSEALRIGAARATWLRCALSRAIRPFWGPSTTAGTRWCPTRPRAKRSWISPFGWVSPAMTASARSRRPVRPRRFS
ncbi:AMP-binding protein [Mycobacterium senegalense]|uniref:AMP-binding protein n=1 Tax=Mycolicibacterium senegalense TaxID=1796 RepID=UPI00222206D8|nr:AMP-binding protein [Mycolicibacterium senegalense]MCW1823087.1 AMP-binding protein [Mycolicibacterium senegalense]